jgi:hypothetical protein
MAKSFILRVDKYEVSLFAARKRFVLFQPFSREINVKANGLCRSFF